MQKLFSPFQLGKITLNNRVVMAPLTRSRAIGNDPNDLMTAYYRQRAGAGLIITEGTAPSANGIGYVRTPGIFTNRQIEGWKKITEAVHEKGGKIFIQLMHVGRVSHPDNKTLGAEIVAPSAIPHSKEIYTSTKGMQPYPVPRPMQKSDILQAQQEYVHAAKNAIAAEFDGIELHGANGYLIEQFINPASNQRSDEYGGSIENRNRFVIETAKKVASAIGADKTGIRLSPYGISNDMSIFDNIEDSFEYLAGELGKLKLAYIHLVDHSSFGTPEVPESVKSKIRSAFDGTIILSGGYDAQRAENDLQNDRCELIAFGRPFISNPDLVYRLKNNLELTQADTKTFYSAGEKGYIDYPTVH